MPLIGRYCRPKVVVCQHSVRMEMELRHGHGQMERRGILNSSYLWHVGIQKGTILSNFLHFFGRKHKTSGENREKDGKKQKQKNSIAKTKNRMAKIKNRMAKTGWRGYSYVGIGLLLSRPNHPTSCTPTQHGQAMAILDRLSPTPCIDL